MADRDMKLMRALVWLMGALCFVTLVAGIVWAVWQYRLCMATIGDFWYCIQHAT